MIQADNEKWMRRCIRLATGGRYHAAPNPMVGAVIVCEGRIIGEGYHRRAGEAHAEVNAIQAVADPGLLRRSTLYVSLEPCSHYGKTPPCADLIVRCEVPRVVVGCIDPFAQVHGRGIEKLRAAGIDVTVGVLERECMNLNRTFFTFHEKKRPFITLKWAQSADGFIGTNGTSGSKTYLSSPHTLINVHKLRAEHQAILVGRATAAQDNPRLNIRYWTGENPLRIVLDRKGTLPENLSLFDGSQPTLVVSEEGTEKPTRKNVEYFHPDYSHPLLPELMTELYNRGIQSLLVEGGCEVLQSFIDSDLWDEMIVEQCPSLLHGGTSAPRLPLHARIRVEHHWGTPFLRIEK